jgi:hypothetical protein
MKIKLAIITAALAVAALLFSQAGGAPRPLSDWIPASPLLYIEARDLASLLKEWNASAVKTSWTQSDNLKVFSQSRLYMRLNEAQQEYAATAGLPPDMSFLEAVSGSNSALALYDIGSLQFLYITRMPSARSYQTALWQARARFQPRRSAGIDYYIREQRDRRAAFAVTNDLLLIATDEQALASALSLLSGQTPPAMKAEAWYQSATAAQPQQGELRMVHNFNRVVRTPYFRSYWVQRNARELTQFGSFIADLDRSPSEFRERRSLLRDEPAADLRPAEPAVAELLRYAPADAGVYRAWARPAAESVIRLIAEKLAPSSHGGADSRFAPSIADLDAIIGTEQDLDTRIDETVPDANASAVRLDAIRQWLGGNTVQAIMQVGTSQPMQNGVFIRTAGVVAILGERPWDLAAARTALTAAASHLWSVSGVAGLGDIAVAASGRVLLIGDSEPLVRDMAARGASAAQTAGAAYTARYIHARELPNFERMMHLIDAPALQNISDNEREPQFFSENLASLGRALGRVDNITVESHDDGRQVTQVVTYRLR